jgi:hypothetical protein
MMYISFISFKEIRRDNHLAAGFLKDSSASSKEFAKANSRAERALPQADKYLTNTCFKYSLRAECVIPMRTMFAWRYFYRIGHTPIQ